MKILYFFWNYREQLFILLLLRHFKPLCWFLTYFSAIPDKIKLEEPLQIPERSGSKETAVMLPLTKLRKNKRVKEDPEEDVTFSEEDEEEENEEEDSNEDFDEDEDEEDEDDDGDEEASVSAHASGT